MPNRPGRFIVLTWMDSGAQCRCAGVLANTGSGWSYVDGTDCQVGSPKYGLMVSPEGDRAARQAVINSEGMVEIRRLDLPDFEPVTADADRYWDRARAV